jgi:hypothetical protein
MARRQRILDFFEGKTIVGVPGYEVNPGSASPGKAKRGWNKGDFAGVVRGNFPGRV